MNTKKVDAGAYDDYSGKVRIMTYNICAGRGIDDKRDIQRTLSVLSSSNASIIGLNEVDRVTLRSGLVDQLGTLSERLGYNLAFAKSMNFLGGEYGNGILSKYPIKSQKSYQLPIVKGTKDQEPRSLLYCVIDYKGTDINVFTTHLSLSKESRIEQIKFISSILRDTKGHILLLGDFNEKYSIDENTVTDEIKPVVEILKDSSSEFNNREKINTFSVDNPHEKIDYIFLSKDIKLIDTGTINGNASDHFPLYTDIDLNSK